jgi:hypothetical protein
VTAKISDTMLSASRRAADTLNGRVYGEKGNLKTKRQSRGEVKRPHRHTLAAIANRLGVATDDISTY